MGKVIVTIMLMCDYACVCLFLSTYKIGYVVVGHAIKEFKSIRMILPWTMLLITRLRQQITRLLKQKS